MSDLESIVEPTTVHVIKGATMTLMSFEATPTLPTYLLNGESRDVPTPPAVAISAPTPLPIPNADVSPDTDEQRHTAAPTTALIAEPAKIELPLAPSTQNSKERMAAELPQPDSLAIASVPVKEPEQVSVKDLPSVAAPVLAEQDVGKFSDRSSRQSSTPPLQLGQQFQDAMNSPPSANAISISSDHEVSSTQELVFTPEKRSNSNTLNKSADVSTATIVEETAMVVQNSQIDTTHHLPENSYHMRRRTRKFSDESILHENRNDDPANNVPQRRRKTFPSESTLHVQFTSNTISAPNVNTLTSSIATSGASVGLNSGGGGVGGVGGVGGGSGGSSPSTTTEPVTKPAQTRRRKHTQKRNISQLPLSARSRGGRGVGSASESNGTFVFGCSRLQTSKVHLSDVEPCVVLPASAVVPPVNLGNIAHTYSKDSMAQIKVFVPPAVDMCMENEGAEKKVTLKASKISGSEATTTCRRGRPPGSLNKCSKKPKLIESAEKTKARKTAVNLSKPKTARTVNNPVNKPVVAKELQKLQNLKAVQPARPPPAPVKSKKPARTKKADRVSSRKPHWKTNENERLRTLRPRSEEQLNRMRLAGEISQAEVTDEEIEEIKGCEIASAQGMEEAVDSKWQIAEMQPIVLVQRISWIK
ncbi:uncharacterized protein LOC118739157 [Rhagoletis pomonella]|uniref:uncharacterized protein LOC118739157 n=1 Tax=Rhagoletis pomonella TaxID=28610 RepID=UPI001781FC33|nr:uncharacterized protein LOC118739157 [Rhagoletis pomonella]